MAEYMKLKYPVCQVPGCRDQLTLSWCHIDTRGSMHLRYVEDNALIMCHSHHMFFHRSDHNFDGRALLLQMVQEHYPEKYQGLLEARAASLLINRPKINVFFFEDVIKEIKSKLNLIKNK